ncbi:MAG: right-handed parallel beta-helix repeat-containing protein [Candidatus Bathyarchaeota archaeon]|nr:right-handed parallel beta-helix repeat-containing protein [Candidatus Bathyarchaeota archaeon]
MEKIALFALMIFLVPVTFAQNETVAGEPRTVVVPDDFVSIQEAIGNASAGDTVYVKKGTYHENVVVNKSLSLIGEDVDETIIDGNPPEGFRIPVKVKCDNVTVCGFKLLYGYVGISVGELKFCSISGNRIAGNQHGINLVHSSYCNVTENYVESISGSAIQLSYATHNLVNGNYIDSCIEGIQIWLGSDTNTVTGNTITNCYDHAIRFQYSDNNTINKNTISNSGVGTSIYVSNNNMITRNNYVNNAIQFSRDESYAQTFGYEDSKNSLTENYWSNYNGTDYDEDGYGDKSYIIDKNHRDTHPLMNPTEIPAIPEFPLLCILPLVLAATAITLLFKKKLTSSFEN